MGNFGWICCCGIRIISSVVGGGGDVAAGAGPVGVDGGALGVALGVLDVVAFLELEVELRNQI